MDATGYGFLLLVISIIVFIKFYLLGGGGAGGEVKQNKKLADLSEFDYKKHDDAEVVEKKQPSALRLRPIHKHGEEESTPTAAAAASAKAKPAQQAPVAEEKKQEKIVVAEEKKEEVPPPPPAKQEEPVEEKPKVEEPVAVAKEEVQEESAEEKADAEKDEADEGDANAEDEDEDDDDDDEDEDDEEEEKDLHEVVNSASVPSSSTIAASVSLQGKRPKNEDRAVIQAPVESHPEVSVFGIFDGHDGNKASEYCSKYMVKNITSQKIFPKLMDKAITQGFLKTDKKFLDKMEAGGTTAIVAVLQQKNNKTTLFVANAGDSRCVASVAGSAVALSVDHKPDLPAEQERVNATTHEVQQSVEIVQGKRLKISRIDGTLAVSRAIGDGDFKDDPNAAPALQAVSPVPEIQTVEITPEHEFAVLACDGLWDVLSNQEVVDFVKSKLSTVASPDDLATITKALVSHAVYEKQSTDNVTALIIKF